MRNIILWIVLITINVTAAKAQDGADQFWRQLQSLCGKAYAGNLELPQDDDQFSGKELVMHVRSCEPNVIKVPFFVGDDKSRTWVFTKSDGRITLDHDHRHKDGSPDAITMYGGTTTNSGQPNLQIFPAHGWTRDMIPAASSNVWWITLDDKSFTYNLRRLGTERVFRVVFDLTNMVATPDAPWGWSDKD